MEPARARKPMSELRRDTVAFCVLALLEGRERYVVELVGELGRRPALAAGQGTLYPLLSRLRADGWVETTWQESPTGPPRRYYRPTSRGRRALAAFRVEWSQFRRAVDDLLATGRA